MGGEVTFTTCEAGFTEISEARKPWIKPFPLPSEFVRFDFPSIRPVPAAKRTSESRPSNFSSPPTSKAVSQMPYMDRVAAPFDLVVTDTLDEETDLIRRAKERDTQAFECLYHTHLRRVHPICRLGRGDGWGDSFQGGPKRSMSA
jgi:hypothetical protein